MCPTGHLFLGLASLAPLLLPGLLYSMTTFLHYQGDIMQCGLGKPFNIPSSKLGNIDYYCANMDFIFCVSDRISAWIILLPMYMLFMIPWTLLLIVYRYTKALFSNRMNKTIIIESLKSITNCCKFFQQLPILEKIANRPTPYIIHMLLLAVCINAIFNVKYVLTSIKNHGTSLYEYKFMQNNDSKSASLDTQINNIMSIVAGN